MSGVWVNNKTPAPNTRKVEAPDFVVVNERHLLDLKSLCCKKKSPLETGSNQLQVEKVHAAAWEEERLPSLWPHIYHGSDPENDGGWLPDPLNT